MKNLKLLVVCGFLTLFVAAQAAQLKIDVKPFKDYGDNEFALCVKEYNSKTGYYWSYDTMYINHTGHFEVNDLKVGRYSIAIMHPAS